MESYPFVLECNEMVRATRDKLGIRRTFPVDVKELYFVVFK